MYEPMTITATAARWNTTRQNVWKLIKAGMVPGAVKSANTWLIPGNVQRPVFGPQDTTAETPLNSHRMPVNAPESEIRVGGHREGAGRPRRGELKVDVGSGRRCKRHGIFIRRNGHGCDKCREERLANEVGVSAD